MTSNTITVKAPGKLMVAGEYAVLQQYQRLVVMAVNRYVYAELTDNETNILDLSDLGLENIAWGQEEDGSVTIDTDDVRVEFVRKALELSCTYVTEKEATLTPFRLKITSELDDTSGVKYGLGSSAAVTTAVVKSVLTKFLPEKPTEDEIFKLAAIAHIVVQGNGSAADVASATYGGWIEFSSPQAEWVLEEYKNARKLSRLVKRDWQYLKVERLEVPDNLHICIGWTQKAANTKDYVKKIENMKHSKHIAFAEFMVQSSTAVQGVLHGMRENDLSIFNEGIQLNREVLQTLERIAGFCIETDELKTLCDLAEQYGGVAKPSGAGGGDCGIAFMPDETSAEKLKEAWKDAGIIALDLVPEAPVRNI